MSDMENSKFFKYKLLFGSFIFVYIAFIFFYVKYSSGLFFDIPAVFLSVIFPVDEKGCNFLMFHSNRVRMLNDFLVAIPFNSIFYFIRNMPVINALRAFSASYFIVHLFALFINYLVSRRTKRYDIAIICFAFYAILSIPNAIWTIREINISFLFYFALLSYFLSKTKLNWKDLIPISLLIVYFFESFEISVVYGVILFVFSFLFTQKNRIELNPWIKIYIGFICFAAIFYVPIKMFFFINLKSSDLGFGISEIITASVLTYKNFFSGSSIIIFFALLAIIFIFFYKKPFDKKSILFWLLFIIIIALTLLYKTNFMPEPHIEIHNYSIAFWLFFPLVLVLIIMDYLNIDFYKYNNCFIPNLFIVACIFGIMNLCWQIHSCFEFDKYTQYLKNIINNSNSTVVTIPEEDFEKYFFLKYNTCFGTMHKSLFLSDSHKIKSIIFPSEYYCNYNEYCFDDKKNTYFNKKENILFLQMALTKVNNRYWDLTDIVDEFTKEGRITN